MTDKLEQNSRYGKNAASEFDWRDLFKRYLFLVIAEESTIFDLAISRSEMFTEDDLTRIRKLADEAEDEYE